MKTRIHVALITCVLRISLILITACSPIIPVIRAPVTPFPAKESILISLWQLIVVAPNTYGVRIIVTPWTLPVIIGLILAFTAGNWWVTRLRSSP